MIYKSDLSKPYYKSGEVAEFIGVQTRTVQNYCKNGILDEIFTKTGRRLIPRESLIAYLKEKHMLYENDNRFDAVYVRVSTHKQKERGDLNRQKSKILEQIVTLNPKDLHFYEDVASGLNDNRKGLNQLIDSIMDKRIKRVFILYKDRLTRFGFNYLQQMCDKTNTELIILSKETNSQSTEEELAEDITSIIHSFSGKLYGMRQKVKKQIEDDL